jgi:alpha-glucosidase
MNYSGFFKPLRWWLTNFSVNAHGHPKPFTAEARWPAQAMVDSWQAFRGAIPWTIARQQFSLLNSHDTDRILSLLGGDERLARLAAVMLMTYPGVPCIYYGEEIGLGGDNSLSSRGCMPWDENQWNLPLRQFYQALIHLRRNSPALIEGGFQLLWVEEDSLAFLRDSEKEHLIVAANRGPTDRTEIDLPVAHGAIPNGMEFKEFFSGKTSRVENGHLAISSLPVGAQVWITK